ncbi:hypothetical protein [Candidatus Magnetaquicoccus inordinatus]|uniref:hypothetical protein n=1 Tax=Candidatus Magnetaquicoccus inordinatus TaxID=2496818 RepID=UPI00102C4CF0|nr:hypothetical protein [Candidatus Magnetaquicoccus inordinatus]
MDDYFCGWEELFTHKRREKLEELLVKQKKIIDDINHVIPFFTSMKGNYDKVGAAVQAYVNNIKGRYVVNIEHNTLEDILSWSGKITLGASSVVGTLGAIALTVSAVSKLVSWVASSASWANFASKAFELCKTLGKYATVLAAVGALVTSILNGVDIANMRHKKEEYEKNISELKQESGKLSTLFASLLKELQEKYDHLVPVTNGKHTFTYNNQQYSLEDYYDKIRNLNTRLTNLESTEDMQKMVEAAMHLDNIVNAALMAGIFHENYKIVSASDNVTRVLKMVYRGMDDTDIRDIIPEVSQEEINECRRFHQAHPGKLETIAYKIAIDQNKKMTIIATPT